MIVLENDLLKVEVLTESDHYEESIKNIYSNGAPQRVRINSEWTKDETSVSGFIPKSKVLVIVYHS